MLRSLLFLLMLTGFVSYACACDESDNSAPMGFTAHLYVEIDGQYQGAFCVEGNNRTVSGKVSMNSLVKAKSGFWLTWSGLEGALSVHGSTALEGGELHLFQESFDQAFGIARGEQRMQHDVEGHDVVIYVEGLGHDANCKQAQHVR